MILESSSEMRSAEIMRMSRRERLDGGKCLLLYLPSACLAETLLDPFFHEGFLGKRWCGCSEFGGRTERRAACGARLRSGRSDCRQREWSFVSNRLVRWRDQ